MDHLDLIIMGGYYGEGRRKGIISHFLVGAAVPPATEGMCVCVCVCVRLDIILKIFQLRTNISLLPYVCVCGVCVCVYVYLGYCRVLKQLFWGYHPLL
jgi:hypothetical protein